MRNSFLVCAAVGAVIAAAPGGAIAQGTAKAQAPSQGSSAPAKASVQSVGTLAVDGYSVVGTMAATDNKQGIVVMQKASSVYLCPVWVNNLGPASGACTKAQ